MLAGVAGLAAAATFHDSTHSVSSNTSHIFVDVEDTNGSDVTVTIYGIDSTGAETQVNQTTLNAPSGEVASYQYEDVNATKYPEYRVTVEGTGDAPVSVESGAADETSSGAGFDLSETFAIPGWVIAIIALAVVAGLLSANGNGGRRR
ncbi:hypothetical protein [Natronomonas amylolytica]|uniref:hypothetical protein n=1 Tax=Natronomonas amylolytica TaxID=3108498 RepID=UPI003009AE13